MKPEDEYPISLNTTLYDDSIDRKYEYKADFSADERIPTKFINNFKFLRNESLIRPDKESFYDDSIVYPEKNSISTRQERLMLNTTFKSLISEMVRVDDVPEIFERKSKEFNTDSILAGLRGVITERRGPAVVRRNPGVDLSDVSSEFSNAMRLVPSRGIKLQREAHTYRSGRMRLGALADITRGLQDEGRARIKKGVSKVMRRSGDVMAGSTDPLERHRLYAPLITALYGERTTREQLIGGIDANVAAESARLKTEAKEADGAMSVDALVIGGGVHGAIAAAELRALNPSARIVITDKSEKLGGQFANYGERSVFYGNSRANRKQNRGKTELPGEDGNLNSFGPNAPVQLSDLTSRTYWTNTEMADAVKLNGYLSAEAMMQSDVVNVTYERGETAADDTYAVRMRDSETGEEYALRTKNVIVASGLGERIALGEQSVENGHYLRVEDLLRHFADPENDFPMDAFDGKNIAVIGGGDSARIAMELFARLAPEEAYGKSTVQLGEGPSSIDWFGVDFADRDGFCATNRPRYNQLASFIDREDGDSLIHPKKDTKVQNVTELNGSAVVDFDSGPGTLPNSKKYDIVIDATTLVSRANDPFDAIDGLPVSVQDKFGFRNTTVGQQIRGHRIVFVGPAAKSPLTETEKSTFAQGIKENTAAIWANGPRTVSMMRKLVKAQK